MDSGQTATWLRPRREALGWFLALLCAGGSVVVVAGIRHSLNPIMGERAPFLLFTLAVMFASWYGGWRAGALSLTLSILVGEILFVAPGGHFRPEVAAEWVRVGMFLVAGGSIVLLNHFLRAERRRLLAVAEDLSAVNEGLETRVRERTSALTEANERALALNADLERRAEELMDAYENMESFSYSVSHDLRAPLRAISTYNGLLGDEEMSDEARDLVEKSRRGITRMNRLIDDLLDLSRVSNRALQIDTVNVSELVRETLGAALERHGISNVKATVEEGVVVQADRRLVPILVDNLVRNAVKYSSKSPEPSIEFGRRREGTEDVFFVRDNGVGFDSRFADKLFQPFQRLHTEAQFEGTGIGLAIVARIVERHGGRIWAESEVGKGATFFFTLSPGVV